MTTDKIQSRRGLCVAIARVLSAAQSAAETLADVALAQGWQAEADSLDSLVGALSELRMSWEHDAGIRADQLEGE